MCPRIAVFTTSAAILGLTTITGAQETRAYAGGSLSLMVQRHAGSEPLGGVTWSASGLVGVELSPRLAIEFEPTVAGPHSRTYSYRPGLDRTADVVARRRDTFLTFQLRTRMKALEPVAGVSYVRQRLGRVATIGNQPYFEDARTDHAWALSAGLDAGFRAAPRFHVVPAFRVLLTSRRSRDAGIGDPLGSNTDTGRVVVRCGVGGRVFF